LAINVLILFGSGIVQCESTVFKCSNYIDPIYSGIHYIESIFSCIDLDTPPYTLHYVPLNIRRRKTSTGKHLGSYFARKRRRRRRYVISGSNRSKNDDKSRDTFKTVPQRFHPMETYDNNFHPMDDPSCQDNTWYDAISPYWTGGMIWDGAYVLNRIPVIRYFGGTRYIFY
jgi:hypothetical protein